jgi:hypothetical protein
MLRKQHNGRRATEMPQWLCNQLMRAYLKKDRRQIKMLNDCWFFYQRQSPAGTNGTIPRSQ